MTTPSETTDRDAAGAFELLAAASESPTVVAVLTDEELVALQGAESAQLAGTPFLDESKLPTEQASAIALRSLVARGLVVIDDEDREPEGDNVSTGELAARRAMQVDRTLAGLLALRSSPLAMVNLVRQVADQATAMMVYLFPHSGVLEEFVTADGYHHFSVPTRGAVPARLQAYVDQAGVAGNTDGEPVTGTLEQLESDGVVARQLADTRALTVLTAINAKEHLQLSLMATSQAVFVMDTPGDADVQTTVREVSRETLVSTLDDVLPEID